MKCANCGAELSASARTCSRCGVELPQEFNYSNMEKELLNTVMEEETLHGITGRNTFYQDTDAKDSAENEADSFAPFEKKPGKLAAAFFAVAACLGCGAWFLQTFSTDYVYEKTQAAYQECLAGLAEEDYTLALRSVELLLQEDKKSLEYLALKNKICEDTQDVKEQRKVLKKIIALDEDNYQAYEQLLHIYLDDGNTDAIKKLEAEAPNSVIAAMLCEYIVGPPYLELTPGVYDATQELAMSSEGGYDIYYTLDGSPPLEKGIRYMGPILLEQDHFYEIRAVCKNENGINGDESAGTYQIGISADIAHAQSTPNEPSVYPESGSYDVPQRITIDVPIGCTAYYSWLLGTMLTPENGTLYTGGIEMPEGESILSVIITDENGNCSTVKQVNYTYQKQAQE